MLKRADTCCFKCLILPQDSAGKVQDWFQSRREEPRRSTVTTDWSKVSADLKQGLIFNPLFPLISSLPVVTSQQKADVQIVPDRPAR